MFYLAQADDQDDQPAVDYVFLTFEKAAGFNRKVQQLYPHLPRMRVKGVTVTRAGPPGGRMILYKTSSTVYNIYPSKLLEVYRELIHSRIKWYRMVNEFPR